MENKTSFKSCGKGVKPLPIEVFVYSSTLDARGLLTLSSLLAFGRPEFLQKHVYKSMPRENLWYPGYIAGDFLKNITCS